MPTRRRVRDDESGALDALPGPFDVPAHAAATTNCRNAARLLRHPVLRTWHSGQHRGTLARQPIERTMQYDLLSRLKTETAECHARLENALDLMRPEWPREDYVALLESFYGYIAPWENSAAAAMPAPLREFFEGRRKAALLAADLTFLTGDNARASAVTKVERLPAMDRIGRVFGCMYVMEGSTLGGRFIAPHVATLFGLQSGRGNAYFEGYGLRTGSMWNAFRETARANVPPEQADVAVDAAIATFEGLHDWLGKLRTRSGATV